MTATLHPVRATLRAGGLLAPPALLLATLAIALAALPHVGGSREQFVVASALALDFTVALPAAVGWFWVRRTRLPWLAVVPAIVLGHAVAGAVLPAAQAPVLEVVRWLLVPAEIALVAGLVVLARRRLAVATEGGDFVDRFRSVARGVLGVALPADVLTTEVSLLYYALRPPPGFAFAHAPASAADSAARHTVHRTAAYGPVLVGLALAIAAETMALHVLVVRWSPAAAWILTALSAYAVLWLVGDYRACAARAVVVERWRLRLRLGLRAEADVRLADVRSVRRLPRDPGPRPARTAVLALLGPPNVEIALARPVELVGLYGVRRTASRVRLRVDRPDALCAALEATRGTDPTR